MPLPFGRSAYMLFGFIAVSSIRERSPTLWMPRWLCKNADPALYAPSSSACLPDSAAAANRRLGTVPAPRFHWTTLLRQPPADWYSTLYSVTPLRSSVAVVSSVAAACSTRAVRRRRPARPRPTSAGTSAAGGGQRHAEVEHHGQAAVGARVSTCSMLLRKAPDMWQRVERPVHFSSTSLACILVCRLPVFLIPAAETAEIVKKHKNASRGPAKYEKHFLMEPTAALTQVPSLKAVFSKLCRCASGAAGSDNTPAKRSAVE